jgi:hypothetical protein
VTTTVSDTERGEIRATCERLSLDYSYYADRGEMRAWSDLFTEDAELVVSGVSQSGRAAIYKSATEPRDPIQAIHAISNVRIDVLGPTEATGIVYITAYMAPKPDGVATVASITPAAVGRYEDVYRKTAEGWRFARRDFIPMILTAS